MSRTALLAACLLLASGWAPCRAGAADRLERFREAGLRYAESGAAPGSPAAAEVLAVVDDEVLDSLRSGGPFASAAFIQEQLEGLSAAWAGAGFRVSALGRGIGALTVVVVSLAGGERASSLRIYGRTAGGPPALYAATTHAGVATIHEWPPPSNGGARFAAVWSGEPAGGGARPLWLEVWERRGGGPPARLWSSARVLGDGLRATGWSVRAGEIRIRYQPDYPGWKPGCEEVTEHEDTYRVVAGAGGLALARRQVLNGWHRELGAAVARLLAALGQRDQAALADLVPDRGLREQIPAGLEAEPACEEGRPEVTGTVVVAATLPADGRRVPWSLRWQRARGGWRLTAAAPMLQ
jgi:hypothetical protein